MNKRPLLRRTGLTAVLLIAAASMPGVAAQVPLPPAEKPRYLVIFDLRSLEPGELNRPSEGGGPLGFPLSVVDDEEVQCASLAPEARVTQLKNYVECAVGHRLSQPDFSTPPSIDERQKAAAAIAASLTDLRKSASTRAISQRGSNVVAVVLQMAESRTIIETVTERCVEPANGDPRVTATTYQYLFGRKPQFTIDEEARKSRIATDFEVLVSLVSTLAAPEAKAAPPPTAVPCTKHGPATTAYASRSASTVWSSGHAIPLALKRATVTLDGALPAVVPQLLMKTDSPKAEEALKAADEYLRVEAIRKQESEDLKLFDSCPLAHPGRLETLPQVVCALDRNSSVSTDLSVAAVEALSKMSTGRRATLLRWAVEHKTGEAREKALVALAQMAPAATAPRSAGKEVKETATFLSGPMEHWSLSADLFATRETGFTQDDKGIVVIDGKPPVFYVSLNFLLGDQASTERRWFENIELKWLLQGSDSPFDSIGFGVGLRGHYAKRFGLDFDLLSPFVGWTWTEAEDDAQGRVQQLRFGLSMNINKALDWVK
jgi:hypothetical protein